MKNSLAGQVCVVTGGTQGIGWAIVQALAVEGGTVYACGFSQGNLDRAEAERPSLPDHGRIHLTRGDVTDRAWYEAWLYAIYQAEGHLDVLVNNAAYVQWVDTLEMSVEQQQRTMQVGYDAMVVGTKLVLPWMLSNGRGHIINIGSIAGRIFVGGQSAAYGAVKAAIDAYTQVLQVELRGTAVHATIVRLGTVVGTDFLQKHVSRERIPPIARIIPPLTPPQVATAVVRAIAQKRMFVTMPRYLVGLEWVYNLSPRLARWLARVENKR